VNLRKDHYHTDPRSVFIVNMISGSVPARLVLFLSSTFFYGAGALAVAITARACALVPVVHRHHNPHSLRLVTGKNQMT